MLATFLDHFVRVGLFPAWRPFLDPLSLHDSWFVLLVPLSLFISISYKAVRRPRLDRGYWRSVFIMTAQVIISMILLGAALFVFIQWVLPAVAP